MPLSRASLQFSPRSVTEYVYPAAWQKHNTRSSFYSVTYSIFSTMIKLTHKYYTFNARKPWFIQPVECLFVHFLMLLGTPSFHDRVWNNENHHIYLTCTINRAGFFQDLLYYAVPDHGRNVIKSIEELWGLCCKWFQCIKTNLWLPRVKDRKASCIPSWHSFLLNQIRSPINTHISIRLLPYYQCVLRNPVGCSCVLSNFWNFFL